MSKRKRKSNRYKRRKIIFSSADFLVKELKNNGVVIQRYNSKTSNSVYLKLDYGVLNSIRISDHKGKKHLKYKYNVLTVCPRPIATKNKSDFGEVIRYYFPVNQKEQLLEQIITERKEKITSYGDRNYKNYMEIKVAENYTKTGFWQQGEIV